MNNSSTRRIALIAGAVFLFALASATPVKADEWNLTTIFSVNKPVEVPGGKILEANTKYVIRLMDSPANRGIVQILDKDQVHLITTFFGIPKIRQEATDRPVFEFMEVPEGNPVPMSAWFYPWRTTGYEFMYPKHELEKIAAYKAKPVVTQTAEVKEAPEPIAATPENDVAESAAFITAPVLPSELIAKTEPEEQAVERSKPTPAEEEVTPEPNVTPEQDVAQSGVTSPQENVDTAATPTQLPHTSGELILYALLGALSLGVAVGARMLRQKIEN